MAQTLAKALDGLAGALQATIGFDRDGLEIGSSCLYYSGRADEGSDAHPLRVQFLKQLCAARASLTFENSEDLDQTKHLASIFHDNFMIEVQHPQSDQDTC